VVLRLYWCPEHTARSRVITAPTVVAYKAP
jgi:hypothetical protein